MSNKSKRNRIDYRHPYKHMMRRHSEMGRLWFDILHQALIRLYSSRIDFVTQDIAIKGTAESTGSEEAGQKPK